MIDLNDVDPTLARPHARPAACDPRRSPRPADRDRRRHRRDPHPDRRRGPEAPGEPHADRPRLVPPREDCPAAPRARARRAPRAHRGAARTKGSAQGSHHRGGAPGLRRYRLGDGARGGAPGARRRGPAMTALPEAPSPTRDAIFASYEADADTGFRPHLGASQIGKSCERALWYDFRWTTPARFPGRILRLFETGQLEEARIVPQPPRASAQPCSRSIPRPAASGASRRTAATSAARSMLSRSASSRRRRPGTSSSSRRTRLKSFRELVAKGVAEAKPQHWAQMQIYMHLTGLTRAMYVAVCKDTDDLHIERVPRRRRRRRAAAREGRPRDRRPPAAGAHLRGSRPGSSAGSATTTTSVMATRRPRSPAGPACIRRRSKADGTAPAGTRRSATRSSAPPAPGTSSSPIWCPARWPTPAMIMSSTACATAPPGSMTRGRRRWHADAASLPAGRHRRDLRLLRREAPATRWSSFRPPAARAW